MLLSPTYWQQNKVFADVFWKGEEKRGLPGTSSSSSSAAATGTLCSPTVRSEGENGHNATQLFQTNATDEKWLVPALGRLSASLLRLVRLSAPNWLRIPGSISVSCLFSACPVMVKVLAPNEAWTFGLLKWITVPWFVNMFTCRNANSFFN